MKQIRQTLQKEVTYNTLINMMGHPTAEEVYNAVHENFPHISKATVYRNLSSLEEKGLIKRVPKLGCGSDRYDKNINPHFHAKCKNCGKILIKREGYRLPEYNLKDGYCIFCGTKCSGEFE